LVGAAIQVVRVPWVETRITHNNFGYRGLKPELVLGFFGFGVRVSGILPSHRHNVWFS